jgi:anti-sigma B factor antagonist
VAGFLPVDHAQARGYGLHVPRGGAKAGYLLTETVHPTDSFFGLDVSVEHADGGTALVHVSGELDLSTSAQLEDELEGVIRGASGTLILDLSGLAFLDSTGLRSLWRTRQAARSSGGRLVIRSPSEQVMRVLRVTKLDKVFQVIGPDGEAIEET